MTPEVPAAIPKPGWKQKWGRLTPGLVNLLPYDRHHLVHDLIAGLR